MRSLIKIYLVSTLSLYLASMAFGGIVLANGNSTLFVAGLGLALISLLAKPFINILLLPINLITFGLFRWVSGTIALYLVTLIIPGFEIVGFSFAGFSSKLLDLPSFNLTGIFAFIGFSFAISVIASIIHWLIK